MRDPQEAAAPGREGGQATVESREESQAAIHGREESQAAIRGREESQAAIRGREESQAAIHGREESQAETPAHAPRAEAPHALDDFLARAERGLRKTPPDFFRPEDYPTVNGDHVLNADLVHVPLARKPRHAAVLVPVIARPEPAILLTLRSAQLSNHAGQIAFPGGRVDPEDADECAAALREAREEVGLDSDLVRPLGYLDGYLSRTDFWIVPVVGLVDPGYSLTLNPAEVDEAFEVPLTFLMSPQNHQRHAREWKGTLRHFYAMPYEGRFIWGATAGMLRNLYERVYA